MAIERWETHLKCKACNGTGMIIEKYIKEPNPISPSNLDPQTTMLETWQKFIETKMLDSPRLRRILRKDENEV